MNFEKKVPFGAKQEVVITPKDGYEVAAVEVYNQATGQIVPSELERVSDNPMKCICRFTQPAGVVSVRPVMKPLLFSVYIEECENCSIVLLDSNDVADIQMRVAGDNASDAEGESSDVSGDAGSENESEEAEEEPSPEDLKEEIGERTDAVEAVEEPKDAIVDEAQEEPVKPEEVTGSVYGSMEDMDGPDGQDEDEEEQAENAHDVAYDAGAFAKELEEVEPTYITEAEYNKKNQLYLNYRRAKNDGKITESVFREVEKKHMAFMDDISAGRIVVV